MTETPGGTQPIHHRVKHHLRNAFIPHAGNNYHPHALRKRPLQVTGAILVGAKVAVVLFVSFYANQADVTSVTPTAIISLTNKARADRKIATLRSNDLLRRAAAAKAKDMVTKGYFAHVSPTNVSPWYWFRKAGYRYAYAGENLAIDFTDSEGVIAAWLKSPSHRANLLSTRYKDIGVATATGMINGAQSLVVVQMFGAPVRTVTTKSDEPVQTPEPAATKQQLVQTPTPAPEPQPVVRTTPPDAPIVESPANGSVVQTITPTFVGRAEAGTTLKIMAGDIVLASGVVPSTGVFSLTLEKPLTEGNAPVTVSANAGDLVSVATPIVLTVDTVAPAIAGNRALALPSLAGPDIYDVFVQASDDVTSMKVVGAEAVTLVASGNTYRGRVMSGQGGVTAGSVQLQFADAAGNTVVWPFFNTDHFLTGVAASPTGPASRALQLIFASRTFLAVFFGLVLFVGMINISMNWRRHHHPALLGMLLLLYVAGSLAVL